MSVMHFIMVNDGGFEFKLTNDWTECEGGMPKGLWSFELKRNFSTWTELQIHKTSGTELQIHKTSGAELQIHKILGIVLQRRVSGEIR